MGAGGAGVPVVVDGLGEAVDVSEVGGLAGNPPHPGAALGAALPVRPLDRLQGRLGAELAQLVGDLGHGGGGPGGAGQARADQVGQVFELAVDQRRDPF